MFFALLASFWFNLFVFHEKMRITKKSKNYFFWSFCFFTFSRIFQEVKKRKFSCFFLQWKLRNVFKLTFWHEKLTNINKNIFLSFLQTILKTEIFLCFLKFMCMFWTNLKQKDMKIWKTKFKNVQLLKFHLWLCGQNFGRSTENSTKNIILPQICTKNNFE
jgi:hypothetical protein